jgi:hypothetical protein
LPRPLGGLPGDWSPGKPPLSGPQKRTTVPLPHSGLDTGILRSEGSSGGLEADPRKDGIFVVGKVAEELGWRREKVTRAWQSCRRRGLVSVWPGRPLGEGNGNKPHVFRIVLEES